MPPTSILIPRKGEEKSDLAELRREICARVLTSGTTRLVEFDLPARDVDREDYRGGVDDWHDAIAAVWSREIGSTSRRRRTRGVPDLGRSVAL